MSSFQFYQDVSMAVSRLHTPGGGTTTPIVQEYGVTEASLSLTESYQTMDSIIVTTTVPSASLLLWGILLVEQASGGGGGSDSLISARITISTSPAQYSKVITGVVPHGHTLAIPVMCRGTGPVTPGNTTIVLEALKSSGTPSRVSAQLMCVGNAVNA